MPRQLEPAQQVLLFESRLKLFSGKLKSRWSGPFEIVHVYPRRAIEVKDIKTWLTFKVNGQHLKHYWGASMTWDKQSIDLQNDFIYVRGASVLFDKYSINTQYSLPDGQDEQSQFATTITPDVLNKDLKYLCVEETKWTVSRKDCYTVERVSLKHCCQVWYHFLTTRLSPSTHNSTISKERMLLPHSLMTWRKINMGKIIFTKKNVGSLNFPSLHSALYKRVKVSVQANEDMIPNKGTITKHIVMRFLGEELPQHPPPGFASTSSTPTCALATPSTSTNVFEQQVLSSLERLHKQFSLFEK
ncbi:Retrovirus-related Pol polyprotein from transposon 412 family [Gossypium australe]|uniref:Retrovirus-related Pol polyprotein from transposon 412 family n=1 Tax=Gossypium australe TaxID=47621 RepID=A0A5B6WQK4_9ROSI|nr:Retrovirus-related Pol polyprotein from transposon 412 family [Gossypium australe]